MTAPRLELTLTKPWLGWYPKPTVVIGGRGQPAQWGTGTWQIPPGSSETVGVYLFNRLWKYGGAEIGLDDTHPEPQAFSYRAPLLPFLPGRITRTG